MKKFNTPLFTLMVMILSLVQSMAQSVKDKSKWTPEDIIFQEGVSNMQFSPDNNAAVWTKRRGFKEKDKFVTDIYMTRFDLLKNGQFRTIQMTAEDERDYSPVFSKDGEKIYFISSRKEGKKLWEMSVFGGEPKKVHEFENGISSLQWRDENTLLFTSNDGKTLYDEENKKDNTVVVEDSLHWKITRVYSYNLKKKEITRVTDNAQPVVTYRGSHNGRYVVVKLKMSPHYGVDGSPKSEVYLYDLERRNKIKVLEGYQEPGSFQFAGDDKGFYFLATTSSSPEWNGAGISELYFYNIYTLSVSKVDLQWANGVSGGYRVVGNNIISSLANGATRKVAFYKREANSWIKYNLDFGTKNEHIQILSVSDDGSRIAYAYSTASTIPQFYIADLQVLKREVVIADERVFVSLNDKLKKKPIAKSEIYYWEGANGDQVNGILYYPENYESGKKYPLILSIHGGPTGSDRDSWSERWTTYPQIYSQKGSFVLKPNYHGSGNDSQDFVESIKGGLYYDLEEIDLLNGINSLNLKGYINMDKLGIMGWSNGAILATMMTLRYPDMFKAAAPGAGDVNWTSDYGTCAFGVTFDQYYFGGAPWDDIDGKTYNEKYITKSPLFEIEKIKTPTIIFHGSEDRSVPRDQGWEYYRGLQQVGQAPVKFLWFPDQPHGLQKITHQLRKMKEEIAWFDTYLFETFEPKNEAFKAESPLARKLEMNNWAVHDGLYGKWEDNTLLPEMVALGEDTLHISRFEVTNAQYRFYKEDHLFVSNESNHPISGASKQDINGYLNWLNKKTGKSFRLPNVKEGRSLHEKAVKSAAEENTLNYWAGYSITMDEIGPFKEKLTEANTKLFMPVGSFKATSINEAKIYDVGGNVAEYYTEGGEFKTYGYSAYDYVDPHNRTSSSIPGNVGVRLILEPETQSSQE